MDVELQILKHLPRSPDTRVSVVDQYCDSYQEMFGEVRSYEYFKYLHLGIISPIPRKSFPEIAKVVGINSPQSLHHFSVYNDGIGKGEKFFAPTYPPLTR